MRKTWTLYGAFQEEDGRQGLPNGESILCRVLGDESETGTSCVDYTNVVISTSVQEGHEIIVPRNLSCEYFL